jgi:hypothetical protein
VGGIGLGAEVAAFIEGGGTALGGREMLFGVEQAESPERNER